MAELPIYVLNNLAGDELRQNVLDECSQANWKFGHSSNTQGVVDFWKMNLDGNTAVDAFWESAKERCEELAGVSLKVIRQYANGHTYGQGGQPHTDDNRAGCYTLLYYPMAEWQDLWHGETIYYADNDEVRATIKPKPDRAVFFDSRILHVGRAPSRFFGGLRITVALKLERA